MLLPSVCSLPSGLCQLTPEPQGRLAWMVGTEAITAACQGLLDRALEPGLEMSSSVGSHGCCFPAEEAESPVLQAGAEPVGGNSCGEAAQAWCRNPTPRHLCG